MRWGLSTTASGRWFSVSLRMREAKEDRFEFGCHLLPRLDNLLGSHGPDEIAIPRSLRAGRPATMASLILGPILRYVGSTEATVWVETDGRCEVEVLGHRAATFHVGGRHYALVAITGLKPGSSTPYDVQLDDVACWPPPESGFPPSRIRRFRKPGQS